MARPQKPSDFIRLLATSNYGDGLSGSMADFVDLPASRVEDRAQQYLAWQLNRKAHGVWQFSNVLQGAPAPHVVLNNEDGTSQSGLNYASQDYLALSHHPRLKNAAAAAVDRYGLHSAGSPILQGNTPEGLDLERAIGAALGYGHVTLFPTGWAAGFGAIYGLVRKTDHVILDQYAHNCLAVGAAAATANVTRVRHLETDAYKDRLKKIRRTHPKDVVLVVTEGLFSMDADSPDLPSLADLCKQYDATLLVDIAHDFGALGPKGTGVIGMASLLGKVDLVVGSFSKTFASNGGFLASTSEAIRQYVKACAAPQIFSNAISPLQCAVVKAALEIVQSDEGDSRRLSLMNAVNGLRNAFGSSGIECIGVPSPIVPVPLGDEALARLTASKAFDDGVFANLVEYPAVSRGEARFRMQVMATHTPSQGEIAAGIINQALEKSREQLRRRRSTSGG